jgi:hypothetical protein
MKTSITIPLLTIFTCLVTGCTKTNSVCPPFPNPSQEVLGKIKDTNSSAVNSWMTEVYKHNLKIKACRGEE